MADLAQGPGGAAIRDAELLRPRPGAALDGTLVVEGRLADLDVRVAAIWLTVAGAGETAAATLSRAGSELGWRAEADISALSCRIAVDVRARFDDGGERLLHRFVCWKPRWAPATERVTLATIEAERRGERMEGVVSPAGAIARLELRSPSGAEAIAVGPDGGFSFPAALDPGAALVAVHRDARRAPTPLAGPLGDTPRGARAERDFLPLEIFTEALRAGRRLALTPRGEGARNVSAYRLVPAGDDWGLVLRTEEGGFEVAPLSGVAGLSLSDAPLPPLDPEAKAALDAFVKRLGATRATLVSDDVPLSSIALPVFGLRPPPQAIERVMLVRPGAFATDELYVLAPLAPELARIGVPLDIVSLDDEAAAADAARSAHLDERTVVIVSRRAGRAWIDRLRADPKPFVVYLLDDDPLAAVDAEGLPHRYRRRMIELVQTDVAPLFARCDRLLVSSPRLAARFASRKTTLIEPPFARPAPSLLHLDDPSEIRIVYHGTDVHRDDFEFLAPAIEHVLRARPQVRFELMSGLPAPKRLARLPNFQRVKLLDWPAYTAYAAARPAHLSLAPMLETPFNVAKSVVKLLDSASLGAAGLFSRVEPFDGAVEHGVDGLLIDNDPQAWRRAMVKLIDQPKRLRRLAYGAQAAAGRQSVGQAAALWRRLLGIDGREA